MRTGECLDLLRTVLDSVAIPVPEHTPLHRNAISALTMARAYERDGRTFLAGGDAVNALASAWYGSGWLHFGLAYGLLETMLPAGCPFLSPCAILDPSCSEKLEEKARRYERLLNTARGSVECTGELATGGYRFAEKVLLIASVYAVRGAGHLAERRYEDALASFSYGHGWLDAGVTSGLFRITGNRDLFTV